MAEQETTGALKETSCELNIEWEIANLFSLSDQIDKPYYSPPFYFSDATWFLGIYLNVQSRNKSEGRFEIHIIRGDSGPPKSVTFKLFLKVADGVREKLSEGKVTFEGKLEASAINKVLLGSILLERKSELAPADVFTVICSMKHDVSQSVENSLFTRLQNLGTSMKKILTEGRRSDVVAKVEEREFAAHRVVLESRSPVFAGMFGHDTEEERTGVVNIKDVHPDAFQATLSYMYSGEVDSISQENVFQIYQAADKYDLKELKQLCKIFMENNLSEEHVCDVFKFADFYKEEELSLAARQYFNRNVKNIVKTESWKIFYRENQELAMDLLAATIEERL